MSKKQNLNDNVVFVGSKPLVNYIKAVITQFTRKDAPEVIIKSRGKFISKAVDVAEVSRRTLEAKGVKVKEITIASESFEVEGRRTNISTMDIVLSREV
ncbi:MAG: DNA-binding protein Alba [Nanoarchaeota archaeon]|nr:DNA-binding protein Alba [Nanoarchaeota archaeon]